ncbi:MAG: peptidylprolyl isomerase, partial [Muribaculaceae bacterium]|nr:peptidylprolyl isomerase [Muribaculaceae bacterium]
VEGEVIEVGDKIKMDFNHPFADLTVKYVGEVEEVRDATEEELKPRGGCCGGCGGGCGSDGDCGSDCGGGCGC